MSKLALVPLERTLHLFQLHLTSFFVTAKDSLSSYSVLNIACHDTLINIDFNGGWLVTLMLFRRFPLSSELLLNGDSRVGTSLTISALKHPYPWFVLRERVYISRYDAFEPRC